MSLMLLKLVTGDLVMAEGERHQSGDVIITECQVFMQTPVYGGSNGAQLVGMNMMLIDFMPTEKPITIANINLVAVGEPDNDCLKMWDSYKARKLQKSTGIQVPRKSNIEIVK